MAKVYFITGTLGGGKSLCAVDMARKYLVEGKKVATNINLNMEYLCGPENKHSRVIRVPDSPTITDLRAIGFGSTDQDPNKHGLLILDELGTWFNARDFNNKDRMKVIKWMIHMRKRRWDVGFLVQDFTMVDKQARGNIAQYLVSCKSSKDYWLFRLLPKFHIANVVHGPTRTKAGNWFYRGKDCYPAYDTEQLFYTSEDDDGIIDADAEMSLAEEKYKTLNGLYSVLPTAYLGKEVKTVSENHFQKLNGGRKKIGISIAAALVVLGVYVTLPASSINEAQASEENNPSSTESDQAEAQSGATRIMPVPDTMQSKFGQYRIVGHSNFGGNQKYTFSTPDGNITSTQLEFQGYTVRPRGRSEALIIDENYDFLSVY